MPQLTPLAWALWLLTLVGQPALVILMARSGAWRRWPSLFSYLALRSLGSFSLLAITLGIRDPERRAFVYFWTYWGLEFAADILQVWIIAQIGSQIAGATPRIRRWIHFAVPTVASVALVCISWMTLSANLPAWGRASHIVLDLSRAINCTWLLTLVIAIAAWEFAGLRIFGGLRWVAIGYTIMAVDATSASWLLACTRSVTLISDAHAAIYLACLGSWTAAFRAVPDYLPPSSLHDILRLQTDIESFAHRIAQRTPELP